VNDLTQNAVFAALLPIFKQFLDEPDIELNRNSNALNLPKWDSLAHVEVVEIVQCRCKVKFSLADLQKLKTVRYLVDLILGKSAQ
jgi:acyl carrier protein